MNPQTSAITDNSAEVNAKNQRRSIKLGAALVLWPVAALPLSFVLFLLLDPFNPPSSSGFMAEGTLLRESVAFFVVVNFGLAFFAPFSLVFGAILLYINLKKEDSNPSIQSPASSMTDRSSLVPAPRRFRDSVKLPIILMAWPLVTIFVVLFGYAAIFSPGAADWSSALHTFVYFAVFFVGVALVAFGPVSFIAGLILLTINFNKRRYAPN